MNNTNKAFLQHINSHNSHNHWFKTLNLFCLDGQKITNYITVTCKIYTYTRYTDIHIIMLRIQPGNYETYIESRCK